MNILTDGDILPGSDSFGAKNRLRYGNFSMTLSDLVDNPTP
jgi:hypothetical protein